MTEEETKIARAFVACGRWKWLPGMRGHDRFVFFRVVERFPGGFLVRFRNPSSRQHKEHRFWDDPALNPPLVPDITDPITAWGPLELVKRAGAFIIKLSILPMGCHLVVEWPDGVTDSFRGTFAGVLLRALQAAPEVQS